MQQPQPYCRSFDGWWYVQIREGGKRRQIKLAQGRENEEAARKRYHQIMVNAGKPQSREPLADDSVVALLDTFFDDCVQTRSQSTSEWYRYFLESFGRFIASFLVLRQVFQTDQYVGIAVTVVGSVWMCLLDRNAKGRWRSFILMLGAAFLHVFVFLLLDWVFQSVPYFQGFLLTTAGVVFVGIVPLVSRKARAMFRRSVPMLQSLAPLLIGIEAVNLLAYAASAKAVQLGEPALVSAAEATMPGFCFLLSACLLKFAPALADPRALRSIIWKLTSIGCMVVGVTLL